MIAETEAQRVNHLSQLSACHPELVEGSDARSLADKWDIYPNFSR